MDRMLWLMTTVFGPLIAAVFALAIAALVKYLFMKWWPFQACLFNVRERTMNAKTILAASFAALSIGMAAPGVAATATQNDSTGSGMMQQQGGSSSQNSSMKGDTGSQGAMGGGMMGMHEGGQGDEGASHAGMREGGRMSGGMMGMMGGGAMGGGMMGMMQGCPMAMGTGLDRKTAMKMRGEMMRAMGDILIKYADKIQEPATKQ